MRSFDDLLWGEFDGIGARVMIEEGEVEIETARVGAHLQHQEEADEVCPYRSMPG